MHAWCSGEETAFAALYARWRLRLYRYLAHQAPREADELFQDVWLRISAARSQFMGSARFSTWMFRIAHHRLIDHFRMHARHLLVEYDDESLGQIPAAPELDPLTCVQRQQAAAALLAAVQALPAPQREAFLLAEEGELSLDEIAQAMGVPRETAKSRLRYAQAKLRSVLAVWR